MVEDVGLFLFIYGPGLLAGEEIDFDRESVGSGFLLGHDDVKALVHVRIVAQIALDVEAVQLDVGEDFIGIVLLAFCHQRQVLADPLDHVLGTYHKAVEVYEYAFVCPPAAAFLHPAPVLERDADEGVWRDHGDGVVPVADLYGVEGDFLDRAVRAAVGHLDPVADTDHIVLRQLYSCDKSQNAVLEYEHENCG